MSPDISVSIQYGIWGYSTAIRPIQCKLRICNNLNLKVIKIYSSPLPISEAMTLKRNGCILLHVLLYAGVLMKTSIDIIDYTDIVIKDVLNGSYSSSIDNKSNQGIVQVGPLNRGMFLWSQDNISKSSAAAA
jgi:hypothetical protein